MKKTIAMLTRFLTDEIRDDQAESNNAVLIKDEQGLLADVTSWHVDKDGCLILEVDAALKED